MASTLRTYLKEIEGDINIIQREVDPLTQVGDLICQSKKAILFQKVKGYPNWRICDLLVRDRKSQARALRTTPDRVIPHLAEQLAKGKGKVTLVPTGPVKEKIVKGGEVDLTKIPFCVHSPKDVGPYLGSGMCVTKDPETGAQNVAFHRMQIKGRDHTAFHLSSPHNAAVYRKYQAMKKPMPMAVVIGHHPCYEIVTGFSGDHGGYSEHEMVGSLLDETVELVKCETVDLEVPAEAEIVLEGEVPPDVMEDEGPFGEGMLYYSKVGKRPILKIKAISMREDAIFRQINATPFTDHQILAVLTSEAQLFTHLKKRFNVHDVFTPPWSGLNTVIQITAHTEQEVRDALLATIFTPPAIRKIAIAVDEDIDIYDAQDLFYALATRVNPATDIVIIEGTSGFPMDPSTKQIYPGEIFRVGSKMMIDATKAPLMRGEERERFERVNPKGWGKSFLEDFLPRVEE